MSKRLNKTIALVTGGKRGIGSAIADAYVREGASVAIADLPGTLADSRQEAIRHRNGHQIVDFDVDVADAELVRDMVTEVADRFGRIDVLVNNAGISQRTSFVDMTVDDWDKMIAVNLRGVFLVTHEVVPLMQKSGGGSIINVTSQMGQRGGAMLAHYSAAKAGVIGLTKALARELAPAIRVNAIAPGPIITDLIRGRELEWYEQMERQLPLGRLGDPDEVAPSAVFLACGDGALYTGQTLGPNCGDLML